MQTEVIGHISYSSGLAKIILQDTVKGEEDKADRRRWEDNNWEQTGHDFAKSKRAAENRK